MTLRENIFDNASKKELKNIRTKIDTQHKQIQYHLERIIKKNQNIYKKIILPYVR